MLIEPPIVRTITIDDGELRRMLEAASAAGETANFFDQFAYHFPGHPAETLLHGQRLLAECQRLAPDAYAGLHKGTPFYWLAEAAFVSHDYETAAFYIDAAVSEDIAWGTIPSPAQRFFLFDDVSTEQALKPLVEIMRKKLNEAVDAYESRPLYPPPADPTGPPPLTFPKMESVFLHPALAPDNEHLRTLVTTLMSFLLEWDHRSTLIKLRTEKGTSEPFFMHLFKGCVLFESLLKASPKKPRSKDLDKLLRQLRGPLMLPDRNLRTGGFTFDAIIKNLPSDDNSVCTAVERTGRIRNTTGHNLGWQVSLTSDDYDKLAGYVASSCLHAIACLYPAPP